MAWPKNSKATPCFCNFNCPPGSNPYHNYLVRSDDPGFPEFFSGQLATWRVQTDDLCGWSLLDPDEVIVAAIDISETTISGLEFSYEWVANVSSPTNTDTFRTSHGWNTADLPIIPILQPGCGAEFALLNGDIIPKELLLTPVPDWVCDLDQMREWLAGLS